MIQHDLTSRKREVELALENDDLNRVSRRCLDLVYDFDLPSRIRTQAIQLRIAYNQTKKLGSSGNDNSDLKAQFIQLMQEVDGLQIDTDFPLVEEIICEVDGIGKDYGNNGSGFSLNPIHLTLRKGLVVGLVGENGNGKTTLLRLIAGEIEPTAGKLTVFEGDQEIVLPEEKLAKIAFIPQRIPRWWGSVKEQVSFEGAIKGIKGGNNEELTEFIIHRLGLTNFANHKWSELSSGYKLRVEIAKALVWQPKLLILDEPLANLDLKAQELLLQDLRDLADSPKLPVAIILSSQQLHEVELVADQIVFLKNGRSVYNGKISDLKNTDELLTVELHGNFTYESLKDWFSPQGVKIEQTSKGFTLYAPQSIKPNAMLQKLLDESCEIEYFRDITNSTKKLFNDKF